MRMTNLIKISDAAKKLGVKRQRVYQMIEEGKIQVIELYGIKLVDEDKLTPDLIKRKDKKVVNSAESDN
jgi:excisionase family DNA binding protein